MDAISYAGDKFGRTTGDTVRQLRHSTFAEFKNAAAIGSNETIFKNGINFFDYIDEIKTSSASERTKILSMFKARGITKLPDGRSIESIVK